MSRLNDDADGKRASMHLAHRGARAEIRAYDGPYGSGPAKQGDLPAVGSDMPILVAVSKRARNLNGPPQPEVLERAQGELAATMPLRDPQRGNGALIVKIAGHGQL